MRLDAGMDSGPIFSRAQIPILPYDDSQSLLIKLFQIGARMLTEVLAILPDGKLIPEPQNEAEVSYTRQITREEGLINWNLPATEIWRRVRAYQPWPGAYTFWQGKQLKIIEAVPLTIENAPHSGQVISLPSELTDLKQTATVGVGTGNGILSILKLQVEGKRAISMSEFLRGQRGFIGSVLSEKAQTL